MDQPTNLPTNNIDQRIDKELKGDDWFHHFAQKISHRLVGQQRTLMTICGVVVIALVATLVAIHFSAKKAQAALEALEAVETDYQKVMADTAKTVGSTEVTAVESKLKSLVAKQWGTDAAMLGSYYLGELYYHEGKFTEAIESYERYLSKLSRRSPLYSMVMSSIGYCYEELGKSNEAAEKFLQAATLENAASADHSYMNAARNYEKAGKAQEARSYYQKVVDEFSESTLQGLAKSKLSQIASK
jgi:tetratricopeptide (TPR) repeat protein